MLDSRNVDLKPPQRVVIVSSALAPFDAGGVASYTRRLADELRRRDIQTSVIVVRPRKRLSQQPGEKVVTMDTDLHSMAVRRVSIEWQSSLSPYGALYLEDPRAAEAIRSIIQHLDPDVVHCTTSLFLGGTVVRALTALACPIVVTLTDSWWICPKGALLRGDGQLCSGNQDGITCAGCMFPSARATRVVSRLPAAVRRVTNQALRVNPWAGNSERVPSFIATVERRRRQLKPLFASIDRAVAPSQYLRRVHLKAGMGRPEQIEYLPHGVDREVLKSGAGKSISSRMRFAFTSRLERDKGVDLLLEAFSRLATSDAELHLWGGECSGDAHSEWHERCVQRSKQTENVFVHPVYRGQDVADVLRQIDVVVLPSRYPENAPLVISEAFGASTPVIVANAGGMAELVGNDRGGLRFERGNAEDLRRVMLRLIDEPHLLDQLRSTIPEVPSLSAEVERLVEIYTEVQSGHQHHFPSVYADSGTR